MRTLFFTMSVFACLAVSCYCEDALQSPMSEPVDQTEIKLSAGYQYDIHSKKNAKHRYSLFLPSAIEKAVKDGKKLPLLIVQNAGGYAKKDIPRYEKWAEKWGVMIVGIHDIHNGMPDHDKREYRGNVISSLQTSKLPLHPHLWFTIGMSGGSAEGYRAARQYPRNIAGCVMIGAASLLPDGIIPSIHHGAKDDWSVEGLYANILPKLESSGRPFEFIISRTLKHEWSPQELQDESLTWMLALTKLTNPYLSPEDKAAYLAETKLRIQEAIKNGDRKEVERLLRLPIKELNEYPKLVAKWVSLVDEEMKLPVNLAYHEGHNLVVEAQAINLHSILSSEFAKMVDNKVIQRWKNKLNEFERDKNVKLRLKVYVDLQALYDEECRAGINVEKLKEVNEKYRELLNNAKGSRFEAEIEKAIKDSQHYIDNPVKPV